MCNESSKVKMYCTCPGSALTISFKATSGQCTPVVINTYHACPENNYMYTALTISFKGKFPYSVVINSYRSPVPMTRTRSRNDKDKEQPTHSGGGGAQPHWSVPGGHGSGAMGGLEYHRSGQSRQGGCGSQHTTVFPRFLFALVLYSQC